MRRSRKKRPEKPLIQEFRSNEQIRIPQVRLINDQGEMLGVMSTTEALRLAQEAELDLVEVSPKAEPPVCRITDIGSFKYKQEKEARARKANQKAVETKGIRLSLRIGQHDLDIRRDSATKFLTNNDKVRIEMILRGRERRFIGQAKEVMDQFIASFGDTVKIEQPFSAQGGKLSIILMPNNK